MNCNYCEFRCDLSNAPGVCGRYAARDGEVVEKEPFFWLPTNTSDMESMPFFHARPGEYVLHVGTVGCNAGCDYCMNSHVAIKREPEEALRRITPEEMVKYARNWDSRAIIFAINEIAVFLPSALAAARTARANGLKTGCLTNGFLTEEAASRLVAHMDYICVSLKSIRDEFYKNRLRLPSVAPVLRNIRAFCKRTHVEIVTPIDNDVSYEELREIADFIYGLNPETPWHLFQMFKAHKTDGDKSRSFEDTFAFMRETRTRLPYVYFASFPGSPWVDTICPKCGRRVVRRISIGACGSKYLSADLTPDDRCPECGQSIPITR
jgi:pyruvate-formate lyase-activating enzyme